MPTATQTTTYQASSFFGQTMAYFALALASAAGAVAAGFYLLPPSLILNTGFLLAMSAVSLILVFTARRWSVNQFGYLILIAFAATLGVTLIPLLAYAAATASLILVYKALFAAVALYAGLALYGVTTQRDLSGLGGFLTAGLIGLIMVSLISLVLHFFGVSVWNNTVELWVSGFGILLFAGFTVHDFAKIRQLTGQISPIEAAIQLFLNFILLFEYILRFMLAERR